MIFASFHQGKEGLKNSLSPSFAFSLALSFPKAFIGNPVLSK
jgi:hypothetical protein